MKAEIHLRDTTSPSMVIEFEFIVDAIRETPLWVYCMALAPIALVILFMIFKR